MKMSSEWVFECEPQHIWPHFLHSTMDETRPVLFHFGISKPVSCRVLRGTAAIGNTRQCTTDRGTINQRILALDENRMLQYRMQESTVWCRDWVGYLEDTFTLSPLVGGRTRVRRTTRFAAAGAFRPLKLIGL